jgi:succinate dehydrogenase/fumarate reductase flavoprotein subunit
MAASIQLETRQADVLVVGGGGAASRAALSASSAGARVCMLTKAPFKTGGSTVHGASEIMSMGAAGFGEAADNRQKHYDDTMRAGQGFIDATLVRVLADEAPERVRDLMSMGVPFDRDGERYKLIQSDFGSHARALGVKGKTGKAFVEALSDAMLRSGVQVEDGVSLVDLVRDADGEAAGVLGFDAKRGVLVHYRAPSVVLGTGGLHSCFDLQVSTAEMTGDGQAICFRHGAELVNLEFHQVGPALIHPYVQLFSGSCFRLFPKMLNSQGREFLQDYLPAGVTAQAVYDEKGFPFTATNVSRYLDIAMAHEVAEGRGSPHGGVFFSFAHVSPEEMRRVLPNTVRWMNERGVDLQKQALEVGVAFQCMNGGVRMTDANAQSSVPGLFVIGELAGGVRGPDRPGGNSLAEGQVFGHRSGKAAALRALGMRAAPGAGTTLDESVDGVRRLLRGAGAPTDTVGPARRIRQVMQGECLVEKTADGLRAALETVRQVRAEMETDTRASLETLVSALSLRNMAQASELVLGACLNRNETRSAHYRLDHPQTDNSLAHSFVVRRAANGQPAFERFDY